MESRTVLGIAMAGGLMLGLAIGSANRPVMSMTASRPWQHGVPGDHSPAQGGEVAAQTYDALSPWNTPVASYLRYSDYAESPQPVFAEEPVQSEIAPVSRLPGQRSDNMGRRDPVEPPNYFDIYSQNTDIPYENVKNGGNLDERDASSQAQPVLDAVAQPSNPGSTHGE